MDVPSIPFNRPWLAGDELDYVEQAVRSGEIAGGGPFTERCQRILREGFGLRHTVLTTSCTDALEMCALLLDLQPGDEVIIPSFSFVSDANAFVLRGARPVFADIEPGTLNLDVDSVRSLLTPRTRAVVAVHYGGVGCDLDALAELCSESGATLLEDNAHGLGGAYRGRPLGSIGALGVTSFHESKNYTCGEGGALMVNDESLLQRAEIIWEKGTDRSRFFRGEVDKYTWRDLGSSFLLSDVLAAHLTAQLEARERIEQRRRTIWERYASELHDWAGSSGVQLQQVPEECRQTHHLFALLLPTLAARSALIAHLRQARIAAVFHFLPLHLSAMGQGFGGVEGQCPVTEDVADRLLRLPLYTGMEPQDQDRVIDAVRSFDVRAAASAVSSASSGANAGR